MATTIAEIPVADDLKAKLLQTAIECQQNFYEICSDWNLYEKNERAYLRDFIGYALFGAPQLNESSSMDNEENKRDFNHFVYKDREESIINLIFEKTIEYGSNERSDGVLLCGIIYNVIFNNKEEATITLEDTNGTKIEKGNRKKNVESEDIKLEGSDRKDEEARARRVYPVPVFKVRAYLNGKRRDKKDSGEKDATENVEKTYYIDNIGRVYDGFVDYSTNNTLPECTMVLPKDGRYQGNPVFCSNTYFMGRNTETVTTKVWIEVVQSPASKTAAKVLMGGDVASTVVTVATMGVGLAAMLTPIGAGVALASAVGAGVSGLWTVGRCAQQLADRGQHGESIKVTNKNALGSWIGIAGGTMGLAATGGTVLLARTVRTGATLGRAVTIAYDAVQIGNLIVNGVGVGYKSYDIYSAYAEGNGVSARNVFLLTAHVFFFCNSLINIRLARNIIESTQGQLLKDYEASLRSNRHRKEFQRIARNTRAAGTSDISSNQEIIRAINKIDGKDAFFQAMVRNRKALSASGAKATFSSSGKITINGVTTIDPIEFASLPKDIRVDIVKGVSGVQSSATAPVNPLVPATDGHYNDRVSYKNLMANSNAVLKEFCLKHSIAIMQGAPVIIADFANVLGDLRNVNNRAEIFLKLLDIGYRILQALPRDEEITIGDTLAFIVQFLWDYVKSNLRQLRPGTTINDPSAQTLLNELFPMLFCRVEAKLDLWVKAFAQWFKTQFPQSINGPFLNHHKFQ